MSDLWDQEFHKILFWKQEVTKEDFLLELPFEKSVEFNKAIKTICFGFGVIFSLIQFLKH
jgi:hypothetical protein